MEPFSSPTLSQSGLTEILETLNAFKATVAQLEGKVNRLQHETQAQAASIVELSAADRALKYKIEGQDQSIRELSEKCHPGKGVWVWESKKEGALGGGGGGGRGKGEIGRWLWSLSSGGKEAKETASPASSIEHLPVEILLEITALLRPTPLVKSTLSKVSVHLFNIFAPELYKRVSLSPRAAFLFVNSRINSTFPPNRLTPLLTPLSLVIRLEPTPPRIQIRSLPKPKDPSRRINVSVLVVQGRNAMEQVRIWSTLIPYFDPLELKLNGDPNLLRFHPDDLQTRLTSFASISPADISFASSWKRLELVRAIGRGSFLVLPASGDRGVRFAFAEHLRGGRKDASESLSRSSPLQVVARVIDMATMEVVLEMEGGDADVVAHLVARARREMRAEYVHLDIGAREKEEKNEDVDEGED